MRFVGVREVPIETLEAFPGNPRVHDEVALDESARTNGQYRSVVARTLPDGRLQMLAGHGTCGAFRRRGDATIRVELIEADDREARRINLADNGTSRNASYDDGLLAELLSVALADGGLVGSGWDAEAYRELVDSLDAGNPFDYGDRDPDDFDEEPPGEPVTQSGDVWVLGQHRIVCGDCRDPKVVATLLDGVKVNVAFTSPPYASQRKYDESSGFKPIHPDEYVDWFDGVQANVREHLAEDGSWFVNIKEHCDDGQRHLYVKDLTTTHVRRWGWRFVDEFAWTREGVPGRWSNRFKNGWEPVFHFCAGSEICFRPESVGHESDRVFAYASDNRTSKTGFVSPTGGQMEPGLALPSNVLKLAADKSMSQQHEAAFPVGLPTWFIRAYSDPGAAVFDPFMGSGTTLVAAHQEGRTAYGTEISPAYCDVIARRYQDLTGDLPVLERTGERFDFHGADGPVAVAA